MDIGLKSAFFISAIMHACIVVPFYNHNLFTHDFGNKNSVVVDYVILNQATNVAIANREAAVRAIEPPTVEVKKAEVKKEMVLNKPVIRDDDAAYREKFEAARVKERSLKRRSARLAAREAAKKEAEIKSSKVYINYYDLIKNKIRSRLEEDYRYYKREGDVYLTFSLSASGALLDCSIDRSRSSKDEVLLHIASASLKAVSPFPPLPKSLSAPKMSFSIIISFKK